MRLEWLFRVPFVPAQIDGTHEGIFSMAAEVQRSTIDTAFAAQVLGHSPPHGKPLRCRISIGGMDLGQVDFRVAPRNMPTVQYAGSLGADVLKRAVFGINLRNGDASRIWRAGVPAAELNSWVLSLPPFYKSTVIVRAIPLTKSASGGLTVAVTAGRARVRFALVLDSPLSNLRRDLIDMDRFTEDAPGTLDRAGWAPGFFEGLQIADLAPAWAWLLVGDKAAFVKGQIGDEQGELALSDVPSRRLVLDLAKSRLLAERLAPDDVLALNLSACAGVPLCMDGDRIVIGKVPLQPGHTAGLQGLEVLQLGDFDTATVLKAIRGRGSAAADVMRRLTAARKTGYDMLVRVDGAPRLVKVPKQDQ